MQRSQSPVLSLLLALAGCGASGGTPAGNSATVTPQPTQALEVAAPSMHPVMALPAATVVSSAPQPALQEAVYITFTGEAFAAETPQSILVVDSTGTVTETIPIPSVPQINGWLLTEDSLWVLDHDRGVVLRVDRASGEVVADIPIGDRAVNLVGTPEGIWAGSAHGLPEYVSLIDPDTNQVLRTIELGAFPVFDGDHLWFGRDETGWDVTVRQVDPATGAILASIDLRGAEGCYLGGRFPDVVWSWCFDPPPDDTEATRLDLDASAVAASVPLGAAGGLVGVHENTSWFVAEPPDGSPRLVKIDNAANAIVATYALASDTPLTIHDGALWMIDKEAGTLTRLELADL